MRAQDFIREDNADYDEDRFLKSDPGTPIPFPKGTTLVDVSDIYDWYKLGMAVSDLEDADPRTFNRGVPHTVFAFGSEEEEHRMIPLLKRLGFSLHDIDSPEDYEKAIRAADVMEHLEQHTNEIVTEGATSVLYHYTGTPNALRILQSGAFELSSITGNRSEQQYAPRGHPYFLSTTRSKVGDYHRYVGTGGVMFVLDGAWFSQRYPVKPIDYWDRAWQHSPDRTREAEDRVFSREPAIPIMGVRAIHVLLKEQSETRSPETRQILILAKKAGIPAYLYTDEKTWRLQDTRNALAIKQAASVLKGQPQRGFAPSRPHTLYLEPWLELIYKNNKANLTPRAEKLRHDLVYYGSRYPDEDSNLGVDMSNARKPNSTDYPTAVKINDYMRKNGFKSTVDLKNALVAKWDKIK